MFDAVKAYEVKAYKNL